MYEEPPKPVEVSVEEEEGFVDDESLIKEPAREFQSKYQPAKASPVVTEVNEDVFSL